MALENKLGLTSSRKEERISKKKAPELFENKSVDGLQAGALTDDTDSLYQRHRPQLLLRGLYRV